MGPHMSESIYQNAMFIELDTICGRTYSLDREVVCPVRYRGQHVGTHRYDVLCGERIIEIKVSKTPRVKWGLYSQQVGRYQRHKHPYQRVTAVVFTPSGVYVKHWPEPAV